MESPEWSCCSMHDPTERRGIWWRVIGDTLEIRAGREGDDVAVRLTVGNVLSQKQLRAIDDCLSVGAWMIDQSEINVEQPFCDMKFDSDGTFG